MHTFLDHDGPIAFAHRGGALEFPENTMTAFAGAVALGYHYLETDAYATSDGVVLAFHDDRLDRVTDGQGQIEALPYETVRRARVGGQHPIPKLADVLSEFPDIRVNIDPKHDAVVDPLIALLRGLDCLDRVCVGSFSDKRLTRMRAAFGDRLCTSMGPSEVARLYAASWGVPTGRFLAQAAQVPERTRLAGREVTVVGSRFLEAAHRRGIKVHVWTVDDPADMERLLDLDVDGLMTDRPSVLKSILQAREAWA